MAEHRNEQRDTVSYYAVQGNDGAGHNTEARQLYETGPDSAGQNGSVEQSATPTVSRRTMLAMLLTFGFGASVGYIGRDLGIKESTASAEKLSVPESAPDLVQVSDTQTVSNPSVLPYSYEVPARYGQLGPMLLETGAIDYDRLAAAQQRAGQPLTEYQTSILRQGSDDAIVFDRTNAQFLLNFFWALGLANDNPILTSGPIARRLGDDISGLASTGGWTAGAKPAAEIYAATSLQPLDALQQGRLATVASGAYRPCCNNPTLFPDCNHGMALLGLLEVVAASDVNLDELYTVAKTVNSFWYPQQSTEIATFFNYALGQSFDEIDPRAAVAPEYFSATGHQQVNQWLAQNSLLENQSGGGSGCSL